MANIEKVKRDLQKKETEGKGLEVILKKAIENLGDSLPKHLRPERFVAILHSKLVRNPRLAQCSPDSIIAGFLIAAELGLEPIGGKCDLIPYFNSKTNRYEAVFQIEYKGAIELFYNHPSAKSIKAEVVYEKDFFEFEKGLNQKLIHKPTLESDRGKSIAYYCIAKVKNEVLFEVVSYDEVLKHGLRYSKQVEINKATGQKQFKPESAWATAFDEMGKKTVLLKLVKICPNNPEKIINAIESDYSSRAYREGIKDAFDMPKTVEGFETSDEQQEQQEQKELQEQKEPQEQTETIIEINNQQKNKNKQEIKDVIEQKLQETSIIKQPTPELKQKKLNFLIDFCKATKIWDKVREDDFNLLSIDEKIQVLESLKKEYKNKKMEEENADELF